MTDGTRTIHTADSKTFPFESFDALYESYYNKKKLTVSFNVISKKNLIQSST